MVAWSNCIIVCYYRIFPEFLYVDAPESLTHNHLSAGYIKLIYPFKT